MSATSSVICQTLSFSVTWSVTGYGMGSGESVAGMSRAYEDVSGVDDRTHEDGAEDLRLLE